LTISAASTWAGVANIYIRGFNIMQFTLSWARGQPSKAGKIFEEKAVSSTGKGCKCKEICWQSADILVKEVNLWILRVAIQVDRFFQATLIEFLH
jgi:hypothetical protein